MGIFGYIHQIEEPGDDFEIYNGPDASIQWVDAPDEVTLSWTLEWSPSQQKMIWVEREQAFTDGTMARKIAYGEVGEQLDMLYHEVMENGTISADGPWAQHVATVKATYEKPPEAPEPLTPEEQLALMEVTEPSVDQPPKVSSEETPCWVRYDGWAGYVTEIGEE